MGIYLLTLLLTVCLSVRHKAETGDLSLSLNGSERTDPPDGSNSVISIVRILLWEVQVQELKEKSAESLDAGQRAKIASEASLIAEIKSLGGTA